MVLAYLLDLLAGIVVALLLFLRLLLTTARLLERP
jgi:hypothetical protein